MSSEKNISIGLEEKVNSLSSKVDQLANTIEDLAAMTQRGFQEAKEQSAREHAETRAMLENKPDYHEVVKRAEFDSLEQRVTQLGLQ